MAVSSIRSGSSASTQQYDGSNDGGNDAAPSSGDVPPNGSPPAPTVNDANEANEAARSQPNPPASSSTPSQSQPADSAPPRLSTAETQSLSDLVDKDPAIPNDAANANSMAALQGESLRGAPPEAISFEQQVTIA
ncbi:hypothetical protein QCE63_21865, partial [Caballeronia sp. LZ065]|nr:hypothetical protein [Caballeronia sp. LZ065]